MQDCGSVYRTVWVSVQDSVWLCAGVGATGGAGQGAAL